MEVKAKCQAAGNRSFAIKGYGFNFSCFFNFSNFYLFSQRPYQLFELFAAVFHVLEQVEAGAAGA